jgi:hypothetical protein
MKKLIATVSVLGLLTAGCAAVTDNVDVDVAGLTSAACNSIADTFAAGIVRQMEQISADPSFPVPDVDVAALLASAAGLGCSPSQLREVIEEKAESAGVEVDRAREFLDGVLDEVGDE